MNTKERLVKLLDSVFEGEIDTENLNDDTKISDLGVNSIGFLYLAVAIEEEFGKKFTNDDFLTLNTVRDVIDFIEK